MPTKHVFEPEYMFVLRPTEKHFKVVCPACYGRGEVLDTCRECHGTATKKQKRFQYFVQDKPIKITAIDRDPDTGILRYWESSSEFFYETLDPTLNKYVPEVPYGVHLCHYDMNSALKECERINTYLSNNKVDDSIFHF
jgi:RecJ-like exonuclease